VERLAQSNRLPVVVNDIQDRFGRKFAAVLQWTFHCADETPAGFLGSSMHDYSLHRLEDPARRVEIYRLRTEVWRLTSGVNGDAFPDGLWQDPIDDAAQHWIVADDNDRIVAAARLSLHEILDDVTQPFQYQRYGVAIRGLIASPDRVVVHPSAQGLGLGQRLLDAQDAAARAAGAAGAVRQASPSMARLLVRRGWRLIGPALDDDRFPGVEFTVAAREFIPGSLAMRHHGITTVAIVQPARPERGFSKTSPKALSTSFTRDTRLPRWCTTPF
jgi:GNAT superfamily N-acetyltransferase